MRKKSCYLLVTLLSAVIAPPAHGELLTKSVSLQFSESDFNVHTDSHGLTFIRSTQEFAHYSENTATPAIPMFTMDYTMPEGCTYQSVSVRLSKHLLKSDATVAPNVAPIATNATAPAQKAIKAEEVNYEQSEYPTANFRYIATSNCGSYSIVHFEYSPFIYDTEKKSLHFIDNMDVDISFSQSDISDEALSESLSAPALQPMKITRPPIFRDSSAVKVDTTIQLKPDAEFATLTNLYDYLIITSDALKDAYEPLRTWKISKGVYTRIATVESICSNAGEDKALAIKKYIYAEAGYNRIKYVLLGGDDTIIPVRGCYGNSGAAVDEDIPTDLYYATVPHESGMLIVGNEYPDITEKYKYFDWDLNKNGLYGEVTDSVSLEPTLYVSRLPVRTATEVQDYVNKLINYERNPKYNHKMLMAGNLLRDNDYYYPDVEKVGEDNYRVTNMSTRKSDAEAYSDIIYKQWVKPYWNGRMYKYFDTYTSFTHDGSLQFSRDYLQYQLSSGYDFVAISTHGFADAFVMESPEYYTRTHAAELSNSGYTIITTTACNTNAFDDNYVDKLNPCLSESFIRNPNSGVVSYFGCSRAGYSRPMPKLGHEPYIDYSELYEAYFYRYLFSDKFTDKNFGKIASMAKQVNIGISMSDQNVYRWLQFGLNPIGDPEMPIYTDTPQEFTNASYTFTDSGIEVSTGGIEGCHICINGISSKLYYRVAENVEKTSFKDIPEQFTVCITKQNYIPKLVAFSVQANGVVKKKEVLTTEQMMSENMGLDLTPENKILSASINSASGMATVTTQIEEEYYSAQLIISNLMGNTEKVIDIPNGETTVSANVASLPAGVHIVSLTVDNRVSDSSRIIKK